MGLKLVAVDIGGTHARFAMAEVAAGRVVSLDEAVTLKTAEHASLQLAWETFGRMQGEPLPRAAAIAVAGPVGAKDSQTLLKFTNNAWIVRPALIGEKLGVDAHVLVNDFAAVAHAVAQATPDHFVHLSGPHLPLPATGAISVVGPGTGLGVAQLWRDAAGYRVQPTEGGHIDFAPLDALEDAIVARLRQRHRRVSVERVVAGPGIVDIYETLAHLDGQAFVPRDDKAIWQLGTSGPNAQGGSLAAAAVDRFCLCLGSVAGDLVLAQGAQALVMAGGLGLRIKDTLLRSGFAERFRAKGRFEALMAAIPVKLITHPQPGLLGAAAAFAQEHT